MDEHSLAAHGVVGAVDALLRVVATRTPEGWVRIELGPQMLETLVAEFNKATWGKPINAADVGRRVSGS